MKRRTRLIIIGCAVVGTFPIAAQAASASTNEPQTVSLHEKQSLSLQASRPAPGRVRAVHLRAVPPKVQPPLERVTVNPGDTLSAIGTRTSRTWEQLVGYNQISNPDLIYAGQIIVIPPANYVAAIAPTPSPVVESTRRSSRDTKIGTDFSYLFGLRHARVQRASIGHLGLYRVSRVGQQSQHQYRQRLLRDVSGHPIFLGRRWRARLCPEG